MTANDRIRFVLKPLVWFGALAPLSWYGWQIAREAQGLPYRLGPDPGEALTDAFGAGALRLLLLTLAVTPIAMMLRMPELIRGRRLLGLFTLCYALLHVSAYVFFIAFDFDGVIEDLRDRPYITAGALAFGVLIPLGITSTQGFQRRLGRAWKRLHRFVYLAASAALVHLLWQVRSDYAEFAAYLAAFALLMTARLPVVRRSLARRRVALSSADANV